MDLENIIEEFLEKKYNDRSQNWASTCRRAAWEWHDFVEKKGFYYDEVEYNKTHLELYATWLGENNDYAPGTIENKVMAVRELMRYGYNLYGWDVVFQKGLPNSILEADVRAKKTRYENETDERIPYIRDEEHEAILEECDNPRDQALFRLLYDTGARPTELRRATTDDLELSERYLWVKTLKKEDEDPRKVYFTPTTRRYLGEWIASGRQAYSSYATNSDYLFPTQRSPQMAKGMVNRQVKRWADRAGVQEVAYSRKTDHVLNGREFEAERDFVRINAKSYRHAFAVRACRNGISLALLAELLGHSDTSSVQHYTTFLPEDKRDAWERFTQN